MSFVQVTSAVYLKVSVCMFTINIEYFYDNFKGSLFKTFSRHIGTFVWHPFCIRQ